VIADARVVGVQEDLVTLEMRAGAQRAWMKNEVVFVVPGGARAGDEPVRLKAEVLSIRGRLAVAQVFESTRGVAVGDAVEQTGRELSVSLGPGLLGTVCDGLQNRLEDLAIRFGTFLPRGANLPALDPDTRWSFTPRARIGDRLRAGQTLGTVQESSLTHRIMVPFDLDGEAQVAWIQQGPVTVDLPVARLVDASGREHSVGLRSEWPVRRPLAEALLRRGCGERLYPDRPLVTTQRIIDVFFPIALGGMACIPGPFGAGKTVLQNLIARYSNVDVVVLVACGERAGEVVETITEFPKLADPKGRGSLMDRTIIVCNTSSMPVAAREASIYTGVTLGEYYRQMGYDVLLIADSTSRWAQAMRETSGRMEEIPGEEAFPAYLDSAVRAVYERAGVVQTADGGLGSLTIIGTVSPAGGNFDEPVTQSTLSTVKAFLGLSSERAYKRFYPAIDPLQSWSRYEEQLASWFERELDPDWQSKVRGLRELIRHGDRVAQMIQVTGEEGIALEEFVAYQKATFVDFVVLQQDAFDAVDATTPLERQRALVSLCQMVVTPRYAFADRDAVRSFFARLTSLFRNLNYAPVESGNYVQYRAEIETLVGAHAAVDSRG
jgi:V/A-type H+-transporting ATPase subunit A